MDNYNEIPAILHNDDSSHCRGTVHDMMPGKNGYTGFAFNDGEFEFVDNDALTFNTDNYDDCLMCQAEKV